MKYQVWTKEEYGELWKKVDCDGIESALTEVDKGVRAGGHPVLTVEMPYELSIKVKEVPVETTESKAKPDQDPAGKSHGKVRRGDAPAAEGLDKGSGDNLAGPGAGDRA